MNREPVLKVKKIDPLPENPSLMIRLDPQTLSRVQPPEALLQFADDGIISWRPIRIARTGCFNAT